MHPSKIVLKVRFSIQPQNGYHGIIYVGKDLQVQLLTQYCQVCITFPSQTCSLQDTPADSHWGKALGALGVLQLCQAPAGASSWPSTAFIPHNTFCTHIAYSGNWKMPNVTSREEAEEKLKHDKLQQLSLLVWIWLLFFWVFWFFFPLVMSVCAWLMWAVIAALPQVTPIIADFLGGSSFVRLYS